MSIFRGGVPYAIDIKRLNEAFPVPSLTEGRVIKHEELAPVIHSPKGSQRYYSVINSWLGHLKTTNGIFAKWEPGAGIEILDPAGILKYAETKTHQKIRQTAKATKIIEYSDRNRLCAIGQQRFDHMARCLAVVRDHLESAHKDMAIDLAPIKSLPKPKLIRQA